MPVEGRLDAAESGGGMAEPGRREEQEGDPCGRRAWGLWLQKKSLRRQRKLLGRKNAANRGGFSQSRLGTVEVVRTERVKRGSSCHHARATTISVYRVGSCRYTG